MRNLLIPLAVILFLITRSGKKLYDGITYRFVGLRLYGQSNLMTSYFRTDLLITNPTNEQMTFNQVKGTAIYNGQAVGQFQVSGPATIAPQATITVPMKIQAFNLELLKQLYQSILSNQKPAIKLQGTIDTSLVNIPFTETIDYQF